MIIMMCPLRASSIAVEYFPFGHRENIYAIKISIIPCRIIIIITVHTQDAREERGGSPKRRWNRWVYKIEFRSPWRHFITLIFPLFIMSTLRDNGIFHRTTTELKTEGTDDTCLARSRAYRVNRGKSQRFFNVDYCPHEWRSFWRQLCDRRLQLYAIYLSVSWQ